MPYHALFTILHKSDSFQGDCATLPRDVMK